MRKVDYLRFIAKKLIQSSQGSLICQSLVSLILSCSLDLAASFTFTIILSQYSQKYYSLIPKFFMQSDLQLPGYQILPDTSYGFDYAVYPSSPSSHKHSIALIKRLSSPPSQSAADIQKWMKIAHSVNKQLWLLQGGMVYPFKLGGVW